MRTGFEFQSGIYVLTLNHSGAVLYSAKLRFIDAGDFQLPATAFGIHGVHPQKGVREQRRFLPTGPSPDFQNNIPSVIRVLRQ